MAAAASSGPAAGAGTGAAEAGGTGYAHFHQLLVSLQQEYWRTIRAKEVLEKEVAELRVPRIPSIAAASSTSGGQKVATIASNQTRSSPRSPQLSSAAGHRPSTAAAQQAPPVLPFVVPDGVSEPSGCESVPPDRYQEDLLSTDQAMIVHQTSEGAAKTDEMFTSMVSGASRGGAYEPPRVSQLFPAWWNPQRQQLDVDFSSRESASLEVMQASFVEGRGRASCCMVSPVSTLRLMWDAIAALILLYETWATPVLLLFVQEGNDAEEVVSKLDFFILAFFSSDILLNFNTGVLLKGKIQFGRLVVVREYLKRWFVLDLMATFPFDLLVAKGGGVFTSAFRILRVFKLLKTLRYLKLLRLTQTLSKSEKHFELITSLKGLWTIFGMLLAIFFFVHVHCCLWAGLRHDHEARETIGGGIEEYFKYYSDIFGVIFAGHELDVETAPERAVQMLFMAYKLMLSVVFTAYFMFKVALHHFEGALVHQKTDNTIAYLRHHRVPPKTQIEVLFGLHEAGRAKQMQKDFHQLMDSDLPSELQRTIMRELWQDALRSLALIDNIHDWEPMFVPELATLCCEETFATRSILFQTGEASFSAYYLLSGVVSVHGKCIERAMADFTGGMWLGENALVNNSFLRGYTATTKTLCRVMNVPAQAFHALLRQFELEDRFQEWCTQELWRGLCGRCGQAGDHFSDDCPTQEGRPKRKESEYNKGGARELQEYLKSRRLERIGTVLEEMDIHDLNCFERLKVEDLQAKMLEQHIHIPLSPRERQALQIAMQPREIGKWRDEITQGVQSYLDQIDDKNEHLIFLSHYKVEAGTEAALIRTELHALIRETHDVAQQQAVPIFLDSDNLLNLNDVQKIVGKSHNLVLLLTEGVLRRPWCLVEVVTAVRIGVPVVLVDVAKPNNRFIFPDDEFYRNLAEGRLLDKAAHEVLRSCDVDLQDVVRCLREIFKSITIPYSPHRPAEIRRAELTSLLGRCTQSRGAAIMRAAESARPLPVENERMSKEYTHRAMAWLSDHSITNIFRRPSYEAP